MENIGFGELLIIIFIIVLLFGGKKIPELAKGLGEGVRSFKRGLRGDDEKKIEKETEQNKSTDEKSWSLLTATIILQSIFSINKGGLYVWDQTS